MFVGHSPMRVGLEQNAEWDLMRRIAYAATATTGSLDRPCGIKIAFGTHGEPDLSADGANGDLCRANLDNGQMLLAGVPSDVQYQLSAGAISGQCPWLGAGRTSRPAAAGLVARSATGREAAMVDLIGRGAAESAVWSMRVVPAGGRSQQVAETLLPRRYHDAAQSFCLERQDKPFNQRNTAVPAQGTVPYSDAPLRYGARCGPACVALDDLWLAIAAEKPPIHGPGPLHFSGQRRIVALSRRFVTSRNKMQIQTLSGCPTSTTHSA